MIRDRHGFTIVELLIVIVVIGILATLSFVGYNGVLRNSRTQQAVSNVAAVRRVAESFYADNNRFPGCKQEFYKNSLSKIPDGINLIMGTDRLSKDNGLTFVNYDYLGTSPSLALGARIRHWDFGTDQESTDIVYLGTANASSSGFRDLYDCN